MQAGNQANGEDSLSAGKVVVNTYYAYISFLQRPRVLTRGVGKGLLHFHITRIDAVAVCLARPLKFLAVIGLAAV